MEHPEEGLPSYTEAQTAAVEKSAAPMQQRCCCHCGADLLNSEAKFCSTCGKAQEEEVKEKQVTVAIGNEELSLEQLLLLLAAHPHVQMMKDTIVLDKLIRAADKSSEDIDVNTEKRARKCALFDLNIRVQKWWRKIEDIGVTENYVAVSPQHEQPEHYLFSELQKSFESIYKPYRIKHDSMITDEMIETGERSKNAFSYIGAVCCVWLALFVVAIWVSSKELQDPIIYTLWITFGVVLCAWCIVFYYCMEKRSAMGQYKQDFEKDLVEAFRTRVRDINENEDVSKHIYLLYFDECEWEQYISDNKVIGKMEARSSSNPAIVAEIFVFIFECDRCASLNKIPKGTIYKE